MGLVFFGNLQILQKWPNHICLIHNLLRHRNRMTICKYCLTICIYIFSSESWFANLALTFYFCIWIFVRILILPLVRCSSGGRSTSRRRSSGRGPSSDFRSAAEVKRRSQRIDTTGVYFVNVRRIFWISLTSSQWISVKECNRLFPSMFSRTLAIIAFNPR